MDQTENLKGKGTQASSRIYGETNFYWDVSSHTSVNSKGATVSSDWFESLDFTGIDRNADGTVNTHGFLILTDKAQAGGVIGGSFNEKWRFMTFLITGYSAVIMGFFRSVFYLLRK